MLQYNHGGQNDFYLYAIRLCINGGNMLRYLKDNRSHKMRVLIAIILFVAAQILAWYQSNSGIIGEPFKSNYVLIAIVFGPIVSLLFVHATIMLYETMPLWSIRFFTFGIGYLVFIPLTWYYLGEEIFTVKNIISFALCCALISIQFFMK